MIITFFFSCTYFLCIMLLIISNNGFVYICSFHDIIYFLSNIATLAWNLDTMVITGSQNFFCFEAVAGEHLSQKFGGMLSTIFYLGGVLGGISTGFLSDSIDARVVTSIWFLVCSIPVLIIYQVSRASQCPWISA